MIEVHSRGIMLSLFAGSMAAFASVFAKLVTSLETEFLSKFVVNFTFKYFYHSFSKPNNNDALSSWTYNDMCTCVNVCIRGLCLCGVFVSNGLMWTLFTKSLQYLPSLHATITNTSSNFIISAIIGKVLFGEILPLLWWIGSLCILIGLLLIHKQGHSRTEKQKIS